ncbi:MAG: nitroreductase family protein [Planctomycetota bacterium]|nr:MAG: nitroreductase family protein [Planctomycetota bacterium]
MEFYDVIKTRRSVRRFLKRPVPDDVLNRVLEAARIAPSGGDRQPWRFVVVKDQQKKAKIASACYSQDFVAEAPVVLVCCAIKCSSGYEPWHDEAGRRDTVIAIDHLILAARNEGLGTCWVGAVHDKQVKKIVNVPAKVDVVMVVPVGYPASKSAFRQAQGRKPLKEICFYEEYGQKM